MQYITYSVFTLHFYVFTNYKYIPMKILYFAFIFGKLNFFHYKMKGSIVNSPTHRPNGKNGYLI